MEKASELEIDRGVQAKIKNAIFRLDRRKEQLKQLSQLEKSREEGEIEIQFIPQQLGRGYMDIMPKKMTKDMNKLVLLIGSQRAGNNSESLNKEINDLYKKIKIDLTQKYKKKFSNK